MEEDVLLEFFGVAPNVDLYERVVDLRQMSIISLTLSCDFTSLNLSRRSAVSCWMSCGSLVRAESALGLGTAGTAAGGVHSVSRGASGVMAGGSRPADADTSY